ncbi:MAG TPA: Gfo/Idh/MocA family oxidoreductase [Actinomycetota bacterium]|nr:Gfo/Idh/MocA family oxidoreductase [Actinomycetota bacterium]
MALLGYGYWGPNLARNLHMRLGRDWVACVDLDPARRAEVAHRYPWVRVLADPDDVMTDPEVDALVVASPARTHAPLLADAFQAGKHVLVEKPLALSTAEAVALAEAADRAGRVLLVGHTFEYNPAVTRMRELLEAGDLGDLWYLHSQRVNLGRIQTDINALWSIGPHDVSIANYLVGAAPRWVSARGARYLHAEVEDVVFATLGYDGGVLAHIHVSWLDPSKLRRTTVVGSRRMVVFDDLDSEAKLRVYDKGADPVSGGFGEFQFRLRRGDLHVPRTDLTEPLALELDHFLECCRTGARPRTDGWNGVRVVATLEAAQHSLDKGGAQVEVNAPAR